MKVTLPYGDSTIDATVPDDATVLLPAPSRPVIDPDAAVLAAILDPIDSPPLAKLVRPGQKACIVVSDVTRPVPNATILPPILHTLESGGIQRDDIVILVGTGLHRASRDDERRRFLGDEIISRYRVVDHVAKDASTHAALELGGGKSVALNREYLDADLRILTGFVEPHLFAGYSGGGKAVLPAIAGAADIMANHDARMVGHPKATWCTTSGNPIFEAMRDAALRSRPSFLVNVTLDERKRITGVFAGDMAAAHDASIAQAAKQALRPIPHLFDVVVVTNMGYPADLNLYQSVKAMSVAAQAVAHGGAILLVAECREGLGGDEYVAMMRGVASPQALLTQLESSDHRTLHDQWQLQVQAMVQARAAVWLYSTMERETVESAHLHWSPDIDSTLTGLIAAAELESGSEARVCVLPFGQLTVPQLTL
jgi:nickel-dependent lactate racemase